MSDTVNPFGNVQSDTGTPPSNGAVRVEKGAEGLSNLALIGGVAMLLAGIGLYAAVKTWYSWQGETIVAAGGQLLNVQHVTNHASSLGLIPALLGGFGVIGSFLFYDFMRYNKWSWAGRLCALELALSALAVAYGVSLMALRNHIHTADWGPTALKQLDDGVWPGLEGAGIGLMSLGGIVAGAGVVGRGLLYWRRRASETRT
jgi:hypothetical protein